MGFHIQKDERLWGVGEASASHPGRKKREGGPHMLYKVGGGAGTFISTAAHLLKRAEWNTPPGSAERSKTEKQTGVFEKPTLQLYFKSAIFNQRAARIFKTCNT